MDDGRLVDLLRRREERGMDDLLSQYGPMLRYIIAPILEDPREREECLSDTVMRAWDRIGQYDPARGSLAAWLSAISRNAAFSRLRAARCPDGGGVGADGAGRGGTPAPAAQAPEKGTGRWDGCLRTGNLTACWRRS